MICRHALAFSLALHFAKMQIAHRLVESGHQLQDGGCTAQCEAVRYFEVNFKMIIWGVPKIVGFPPKSSIKK